MCGIAGAFAFNLSAKQIEQSVVERLNHQQRRRGPDGTGLWSSADGRTVLGHRRLAIIDTGPTGVQPMCDATGRWVISFNGEIYNYRSLREELERLGCVFETNSDTEVLINVIATWGEAGLGRVARHVRRGAVGLCRAGAVAYPRSLRNQASLLGRNRRHALVCFPGRGVGAVRADQYQSRGRRADRVLSVGPRS